jgi:hypothetical protein
MPLDEAMTRDEYQRQVQDLIGHILVEVLYFEIDYRDEAGESVNTPFWNWNSHIDSLDFGLELQTEKGDAFWISWGHLFFQYDIEVEPNTKDDRSSMRVWNVTQNSRWYPLIGKRISDVKTYWSWVNESSDKGWRRVHYPQDLGVTFESGEIVYISAFELWQDGTPNGFADNVTVFFDEVTAQLYGIGPYAKP